MVDINSQGNEKDYHNDPTSTGCKRNIKNVKFILNQWIARGMQFNLHSEKLTVPTSHV